MEKKLPFNSLMSANFPSANCDLQGGNLCIPVKPSIPTLVSLAYPLENFILDQLLIDQQSQHGRTSPGIQQQSLLHMEVVGLPLARPYQLRETCMLHVTPTKIASSAPIHS